MRRRLQNLNQLFLDFMKKCTDDHVNAFGAMSSFFMILSVFPIMIFLLNMARFLPYSKEDIMQILSNLIAFDEVLVRNIVNEIYRKVGTTVSLISVLMLIWSSSSGVYAIILGLNSVYDIDETRNYIVLRLVSIIYTVVIVLMVLGMLVMWVFGNSLYLYICELAPFLEEFAGHFLHKRLVLTFLLLTLLFMFLYQFVPNRKSNFKDQLPGAIVSTIGWLGVSLFYGAFVDNMSNFNYIYGSMASIMLLFMWLYLCMCMVFYGAEINYFFENKRNYHKLVRILRPNWARQRRRREKEIRQSAEDERYNSVEFRKAIEKRMAERKKQGGK